MSSSGSLQLPHPTQTARRYATCTMRHKGITDMAPLVLVYLLVGYPYVAFVGFYLHPMFVGTLGGTFRGSPELAVVLGILYHVIFLIWLVSYTRCTFADAGSVPSAFRIDESTEGASANGQDVLRRSLGIESVIDIDGGEELRICRVCRSKKPARTHHCSICKRCIVKMDHHCPWVGNCVGFGNYKFFVLFLFWCSVMGIFVALSLLPVIVTYSSEHGSIHHMITFIMGGVFGLALGAFFWSHVRLMMQNMTTLESMSQSDLMRITYGWNVGALANVKQVLGTNYLLWFLPLATSTGDGLTWPQRGAEQSNERERLLDDGMAASDGAGGDGDGAAQQSQRPEASAV